MTVEPDITHSAGSDAASNGSCIFANSRRRSIPLTNVLGNAGGYGRRLDKACLIKMIEIQVAALGPPFGRAFKVRQIKAQCSLIIVPNQRVAIEDAVRERPANSQSATADLSVHTSRGRLRSAAAADSGESARCRPPRPPLPLPHSLPDAR